MIEEFISQSAGKKHDRSGGNSKCHLFGDYALLYGPIIHEDIEERIKVINRYNEEGISIARILGYKFDPTSELRVYDRTYQNGWTLQERAKGEELKNGREFSSEITDIENFDEEYENYIEMCNRYLEYVKKISEIDESQLDKFVSNCLRICEEGKLVIDPKPSNFFYDEEIGFTFIDINLADENSRTPSKEMVANYIIVILLNMLPSLRVYEKNKERRGENIYGTFYVTKGYAEALNNYQAILKEKLMRIFPKYGLNMEEIEKRINDRLAKSQYGFEGNIAEDENQLYDTLKGILENIIANNEKMGVEFDQPITKIQFY